MRNVRWFALGFLLVVAVGATVIVGARLFLGARPPHRSVATLATPTFSPTPSPDPVTSTEAVLRTAAAAPKPTPKPTPTRARPRPTPRRTFPPSAPTGGSLRGITIALDPGHNGANGSHPQEINRPVDAGGFRKPCNTTGTATDDGYSEATFNWQLALRVSALLQQRGATVRMTHSDNVGWGPCVDARGRFGKQVGAAVEVSLHADGAPASGHGFDVIVPAYRAGYTDDILPASAHLGTTVRDAMVGAGFAPSTYAGSAGLDVRDDLGTLNLAGVPTVMLECGNMRNARDAALLRSSSGQSRLASAVADAVGRFTTAAH